MKLRFRDLAACSFVAVLALSFVVWPAMAQADPLATFRGFQGEVKAGRGSFTQTVVSVDGQKKKVSSGQFEFQRPSKFKFRYLKPFEQLIVSDGQTVWIYDPDLQQASARPVQQALKGTPAVILAGGDWEQDFQLKAIARPADGPEVEGLEWLEALAKNSEAAVKRVRLGFKGKDLRVMDVIDTFGQRSTLELGQMEINPKFSSEAFRFKPPAGVDVVK